MIILKPEYQKIRQRIISLVLFLVIGHYIYRETNIHQIFKEPKFIDLTFFLHNIIFLAVILSRKEYVAVDRNWRSWLVAAFSFFSNLFFIKKGYRLDSLGSWPDYLNVAAILVGIAALLSLGRSFGIVPAIREIKTSGLYRMIRHPMYLSDILFKTPLILQYFSAYNLLVYGLSILLYIQRAKYEESLLSQDPEYQQYRQRVKYRFIPFIY